jgi:hypothetical protein
MVAGYERKYGLQFATGVIVAGGLVRSVPPFMSWMLGRDWLECATDCLERGWMVQKTDTAGLERERARLERGVVQEVMDLGTPQQLGAKASDLAAIAAPDRGRRTT